MGKISIIKPKTKADKSNVAWLDFPYKPASIEGLSFDLRISRSTALLYSKHDMSNIYAVWLHYFLNVPPLENIEYIVEKNKKEINATKDERMKILFIKNQAVRNFNKKQVTLFSMPKHTLVYKPSMVCCADIKPIKKNICFFVNAVCTELNADNYIGEVVNWGFSEIKLIT